MANVKNLVPFLALFGQIFLFYSIENIMIQVALAGVTVFQIWKMWNK